MKYLTRYLSVLLCFLLLSTVFSLNANAEELTEFNFTYGFNDSFASGKAVTVQTGHSDEIYFEWNKAPTTTSSFHPFVRISNINDKPLINANKNVTFRLNNVVLLIGGTDVNNGSSYFAYMQSFDSKTLEIQYTDGSLEFIDLTHTYNTGTSRSDFSATFVPEKDVEYLTVKLEYLPYYRLGSTVLTKRIDLFWNYGSSSNAYIDIETKEQGLLKSVIEWLKGIKNGISDLFNSIAELPSKLWNAIENGLKNLFVPSEEYMTGFKEDMSNLFESKLGAVYQVTTILSDSWDRISSADATNTIDIPMATIDLPEGNTFSFGGYSVPIIPDGFDFLADICKLFSGAVVTWALIGGLRKRYDEVMGVEQ